MLPCRITTTLAATVLVACQSPTLATAPDASDAHTANGSAHDAASVDVARPPDAEDGVVLAWNPTATVPQG